MRKTKLSAGSNLLWQSSRMMLPEHKEAIIAQLDRTALKAKPQLDEQKLDEIARLIQESYDVQTALDITIFDMHKETHYRGVVTYVDAYLKSIKLEDHEQTITIKCNTITDVSASSSYN